MKNSISFAVLLLLIGTHPAPGQNPLTGRAATPPANEERTSKSVLSESPSRTLQDRLDEARAKLSAESANAGLTNAPGVTSPLDLASRRALLQRLVRLLEQHGSSTAELQTIQRRREQLER